MKPACTSLAHVAIALSAAACGVWYLAGVALAAPAAPAAPQHPAAGNGFAISLATSSPSEPIGQPVTLTATTNTDVGPTPYYITIYSETTGAELAVCGDGTTCSATVTQNVSGTQTFESFVGDDVSGNGHPGFALVASQDVSVNWWFILRWPIRIP
jgi:hypothetical protein